MGEMMEIATKDDMAFAVSAIFDRRAMCGTGW